MSSTTTKLAAAVALLAVAIHPIRSQSAPSPDPLRAFTGAVLGSAGGAVLGGLAGLIVGSGRCVDPGVGESCHGFDGLVVGSAIGLTLGPPVGAHLVDRRRGSLAWSLAASTALGISGAVLVNAADKRVHGSNRPAVLQGILVTIPVLQIVSATLIESTTRRK